jgi:hypothetical protein
MKTLSLIAAMLMLGLPVRAQEAAPAPRPMATAGSAPAGTAAAARPPAIPAGPPLTENVVLHLQTEVAPGINYEVTLMGVGPGFRSSSLLKLPQADGTELWALPELQANVAETIDGYVVKLTLSLRVPVETVLPNGAKTTTYKALPIAANVTLKPGVPQEVPGLNDKTLTILLSKPAAK